MREPPLDLDTDALLTVVRRGWDVDVSHVRHVPVGFGAHHWAAYLRDQPVLFVTLDRFGRRRPLEDLEAAYSSAITLRLAGLEFVIPPLSSVSGSPVVRFDGGALSCTAWEDGTSGGALDVAWTRMALRRLHAVPPPEQIPHWRPLVPPDFAATLERRLEQPWGPGPYADRAQDAVRERLADIARWTARYHQLAKIAQGRTWVVTHGEPHSDNQLMTDRGRCLVDWESVKLAPAERDLRVLVDATDATVDADREMVEMFDLEWRLDEIDQYAGWFAAEHSGSRDDEIAFDDLLHEIGRRSRTHHAG